MAHGFWEMLTFLNLKQTVVEMFYRQVVVEMSEGKPLFFWGGLVGQRWWCVVKSQLPAFVGPSGRKEIMFLGTETDRKNETVDEELCFVCIYVK